MISRSSSSGMVLLEVIVALSIFTMVAFSLVVAMNAATDAANDRNQVDAAVLGLQNRMAQLTSQPVVPVQRDLAADGSPISYRLVIEPETLQDDRQKSFAGFYRVTIKASWRGVTQAETRELTQLVYQP